MAEAAQTLGLRYLGFGDHSQSLTIANGRIQGKWGDGTFDGQVNPDGTVRMKTQPFAGLFEGRIANQTITGRYQGGCNYDLSWRKR